MTLEKRIEEFLQEGLYLRGWSRKTPVIYRRAFRSLQQSLPESKSEEQLSKTQPETWIVSRCQAGMSPAGINIYIRAMNAFCSWLKEQGLVTDQIVLKQIKPPQRQLVIFSDKEIRV